MGGIKIIRVRRYERGKFIRGYPLPPKIPAERYYRSNESIILDGKSKFGLVALKREYIRDPRPQKRPGIAIPPILPLDILHEVGLIDCDPGRFTLPPHIPGLLGGVGWGGGVMGRHGPDFP